MPGTRFSLFIPPALVTGVLLTPLASVGQAPDPDESPLLAACKAAAAGGDEPEALTLARRAEAEYRRHAETDPADADARMLRARVLLECGPPFVGLMARAGITGEAVGLLEEALAIDAAHGMVRFTLALTHLRAPEFFGRTGDAIRELERLLDQQGDEMDVPAYAATYLHLGELYLRRGRPVDAAAIWRRGAALFPRHRALAERLVRHDGTDVDTSPLGSEGAAVASAYRLEGFVVAVSGQEMDDARSGIALRRIDVLTTPGGAADVMNALQTGPGMTAASEGSDLYVRGGDPAETPVFVDGGRLVHVG